MKDIFWGGVAKSCWTLGSILAAIISLTPLVAQFPRLRFIIPLGLITFGFFVSSYYVYLSLAQELERITSSLSLDHRQTIAREFLSLSSQRHTVVADIYLSARNQSADGNSICVHTYSVDIPEASLECLHFIEDKQDNMNIVRRPSDVFGIEPKSERKPVVKAVFALPESPFPIPQGSIAGLLEIIDIHDRKREIKYTAVLERNAPIM